MKKIENKFGVITPKNGGHIGFWGIQAKKYNSKTADPNSMKLYPMMESVH